MTLRDAIKKIIQFDVDVHMYFDYNDIDYLKNFEVEKAGIDEATDKICALVREKLVDLAFNINPHDKHMPLMILQEINDRIEKVIDELAPTKEKN